MKTDHEIRTAGADGIRMRYIRFGHGDKALVILPGLSVRSILLSASAVAAAFADFTEEYTVYVFDRKEDVAPGYTVEEMSEDTAAVMRALGLSGVFLFGASQGGMMALCIAADHPKLVGKAVIASSSPANNARSEAVFSSWAAAVRKKDAEKLDRLFLKDVYSPATAALLAGLPKTDEDRAGEEELRRFGILLDACRDFDVTGRLHKIRCPLLAVGSEKDAVFGAEGTRLIAEKTGGECFLYEGFSHAVYDEAPDFRDRMKKFFGEETP